MARVQCFDCDMPVVVDPNGRCPEGHDLGPAGERIEQSLGRAEPHPDEPQPWIAILDADEVTTEHETSTPRAARPISIGPEPSDAELNASSADGLLQELHALHGTDGDTPGERAGGLSIAPSSTPEDPPTGPVTTTPADHDPPSAATRSKPDAPTPDTPASPAASAPWDDWDDWSDWSTEGASDTPADQTTGAVGTAAPDADGPWSAAIPQDAVADHAPDTDADHAADHAPDIDADTEPTPTPRRAPTVRSEESLSAMAELAALLGDDEPAPAPSPPATTDPASAPTPPSSPAPTSAPTPPSSPTPQPPAAAETTVDASTSSLDASGDRLATVSQLPLRRQVESDQTPPPPPSPPSPPSTKADEAPTAVSDQAASGETIDASNFTARGKKRRFGR